MNLIVGLGNPGKEYEKTRHNIGFLVIDELAKQYNVSFSKKKYGGTYGEVILNGDKYIFLKPLRYMNLSGEVIKKYMNFFKIPIDNILIIYDDMDIKFGKFKLKHQGSSAGHNGLKNIELNLNSNFYKRIKVGISRDSTFDYKDYVLGGLTDNDLNIIKDVINEIKKVFIDYQKKNFMDLMSKYNNN